MKELIEIQSKLNVPKNQRNSFGGYNYRSAEDILEALKPLLSEQGCCLIISDEMVEVGERVYVKATAVISKGEVIKSATSYAREADVQKGMTASQITGSTSSYARKYALNGLFAIDDTKDADATNTHGKTEPVQPKKETDYTSNFESCKGITDLQLLWDSMDSYEKPKWTKTKNLKKKELLGKTEGLPFE